MVPFNTHVGVKRANEASYHEVVTVADVNFDVDAEWISNDPRCLIRLPEAGKRRLRGAHGSQVVGELDKLVGRSGDKAHNRPAAIGASE